MGLYDFLSNLGGPPAATSTPAVSPVDINDVGVDGDNYQSLFGLLSRSGEKPQGLKKWSDMTGDERLQFIGDLGKGLSKNSKGNSLAGALAAAGNDVQTEQEKENQNQIKGQNDAIAQVLGYRDKDRSYGLDERGTDVKEGTLDMDALKNDRNYELGQENLALLRDRLNNPRPGKPINVTPNTADDFIRNINNSIGAQFDKSGNSVGQAPLDPALASKVGSRAAQIYQQTGDAATAQQQAINELIGDDPNTKLEQPVIKKRSFWFDEVSPYRTLKPGEKITNELQRDALSQGSLYIDPTGVLRTRQ